MRDHTTLAYVRVSTEGQEEGMGLDVQRNAIVADAAANGLTVDEWHQDTESSVKERRTGLDALRARIAATLNAERSRTAEGAPFAGKQIRPIIVRRAIYTGTGPTTPSSSLNPGVRAAHTAILSG